MEGTVQPIYKEKIRIDTRTNMNLDLLKNKVNNYLYFMKIPKYRTREYIINIKKSEI